jgi:hypothetical protein
MNKLSTERCAQIIGMMVEGNSIRAIVRMTGASKNTIVKLQGPIPGETQPDPKECNARWGGTPAICHALQPNLPNSPYCTYKDIPIGNCHPDPNGGFPGPTWVSMNQ